MYRSSSSVFMTNNTPSGTKKQRKSTEPESRQIHYIIIESADSTILYSALAVTKKEVVPNYDIWRDTETFVAYTIAGF